MHAEVLNLELFTIIYTQQTMHHIMWSVSPAWELLLLSIFHPERQSESQPAVSSLEWGVRWGVCCVSVSALECEQRQHWTHSYTIYLDTQHSIAASSYQLHTLLQASFFCPLYNPLLPVFDLWWSVITSATRSARVGPIYVSMTITIILKSRMLMIVV